MEYLKTGKRPESRPHHPKRNTSLLFLKQFWNFPKQMHLCKDIQSTPGLIPHQLDRRRRQINNPSHQLAKYLICYQFYVLCTVSEVPGLVRCSIVHRHLPSNAPLRGSPTLRGIWPIRARAVLRYCFWCAWWSNELFHSLPV